MRFVHTADWQLGMTRRFLAAGSNTGRAVGSAGEAQARFAQARLDAVRTLGALADAEGAAFVLVCGDVFESNLVGRDVVARACEALRSFTTPVLLLPGNHDPADAACVLRRSDFVRRCPPHVTVLDRPGVHQVADGVEVVAAPWSSKHPVSDLVADQLAELGPAPAGTIRIMAGHGGLDTLAPDTSDPALIRSASVHPALADGRIHYLALGDRHSTWTDATGRVRYPGAPEVTHHDEVDPGNVLVVDVHADPNGRADPTNEVRARSVPVGRWRFVRHQAALDTDADLDALDGWLAARADKESTAVRLGLVGTLTLRQRARLDELVAAHSHVYAAVELSRRRSQLVTRPDDADLGALDLVGFAASAARELHGAARDEANGADTAPVDRELDDAASTEARDALGLLHRLVAR